MSEKVNTEIDAEQIEIIKKDNKRAGKKYILIILLSAAAGFSFGIIGQLLIKGFSGLAEDIHIWMKLNFFAAGITISILMVFLLVAAGAVIFPYIRKGRIEAPKLMEKEDADGLERMEKKLSSCICTANSLMVAEFGYFAVIVFGINKFSHGLEWQFLLLTGVIVLIAGMCLIPLLQQKAVDLTRIINPEKNGSVYDTRFHKKWEESCDEAEQLIIYKAAYRTFRVINMLCIILWTCFILLGLLTGRGFLPVAVVVIIWGTLIGSYHHFSRKLSGGRQSYNNI